MTYQLVAILPDGSRRPIGRQTIEARGPQTFYTRSFEEPQRVRIEVASC